MATYLRDIIGDALIDLNVLADGETGTAADFLGGLRAVNRLVDQFAAEKLMIYTVTETTFTIAASTQTYLVGAGQAVNVARPMFADDVRFRDTATTPTVEFRLGMLTDDDWRRTSIKTLTSTLPSAFYYNPTYPYGTLKLWPIPTSSTLTGVLYAPTAVTEFASINDAIALPPGYRRMLVKNLAVELAPSYQRQVAGELLAAAKESKAIVKRSNFKRTDMVFDTGALIGTGATSYYIRTGE